MGTLYYGECWRTATVLDIPTRHLKHDSMHLVYLDLAFNSAICAACSTARKPPSAF